jgi:peptidoglycan/LPS O-acetylase OafA/YrhL
VVLFHFGWLAPAPLIFFLYGQQAVSFFFILSGLVLAYSYSEAIAAGTVGWSGFLNLRLARIVPVHVAAWLIATVLYLFFAWRPNQGEHPFISWIAGLFCVQVYFPSDSMLFKWNGQAWSISCELFFYALFPFLLPVLARRLKSCASLVATMIGVYLAQVVLYLGASAVFVKFLEMHHQILDDPNATRMRDMTLVFPPLRLAEFVIGMCLGLLILRQGRVFRSARTANILLAGCVIVLIALKRIHWDRIGAVTLGAEQYLPYVPLLALTILALASGLTVVTPLLQNRCALLLGDASYSLYLLHGFLLPGSYVTFLAAAVPVHGLAARPAEYVLCVFGCIVASLLSYLCLERPARRVWRRFLNGDPKSPGINQQVFR